MSDEQTTVVYVSPDGNTEMPLSTPASHLNWEARGWRPKSQKSAEKTPAAARRESADK